MPKDYELHDDEEFIREAYAKRMGKRSIFRQKLILTNERLLFTNAKRTKIFDAHNLRDIQTVERVVGGFLWGGPLGFFIRCVRITTSKEPKPIKYKVWKSAQWVSLIDEYRDKGEAVDSNKETAKASEA